MSDTEQFLRKFNEAWAREDSPAILEGVTDDIHFRMAGGQPDIKGREAFAVFLKEMEGHSSGIELTIREIILDGDRAAVNGDMAVTDAEGKMTVYEFCDVYALRGGKVSSLTAYVNERKAT